MHPVIAVVLLLVGVAGMQWGARRIGDALLRDRRAWGLAPTAGGALVGVATALPETSLNVTSVALGWPDIGLGTALGSNLPAVPLAFAVAYFSMRWHGTKMANGRYSEPALDIERDVVWRLAPPYLAALALVALLTLPGSWEGLQPFDGAVLLAAWGAYLGHSLLRGRGPAARQSSRLDVEGILGPAVSAMAVGAGGVVAVLGVQPLNRTLGIADFARGLFIVGGLCVLPESFSA